MFSIVALIQFLSEIGIVSDSWVKAVLAVALFFVGCVVESYLQRKREGNRRNDKSDLTCVYIRETHYHLYLDNLDESDKDDAKKSSKSKGDDS